MWNGVGRTSNRFSDLRPQDRMFCEEILCLSNIEEEGIGIVIEVKYPDGGDLEAGCRVCVEEAGTAR